jgi:putative phosphoribosyl transferase
MNESAGAAAWLAPSPLFEDRVHAGHLLATAVEDLHPAEPVVIGLARGGVVVAAEIARRLGAPLDVLAVRKVGHPWQPEYALGAVTPGEDGVYIRSHDGLTDEELDQVVAAAKRQAEELDRRLRRGRPPLDLSGRTALLVDDGLATGATMVAAVRWARARGAARVVVAVPVAAAQSVAALGREADEVVCLHPLHDFFAVGIWYRSFEQVSDEDVLAILQEAERR